MLARAGTHTHTHRAIVLCIVTLEIVSQAIGCKSMTEQVAARQVYASLVEQAVNVSPTFDSQTAISQSARAGETHHSFDRRFYPTVNNHFISTNSRSPKGPV